MTASILNYYYASIGDSRVFCDLPVKWFPVGGESKFELMQIQSY